MTLIHKSFTPSQYSASYQVDEDQDGLRLDQFASLYLGSFSREAIKKKIKNGEVWIEGRPGKNRPSSFVKYMDIVHIITKETVHEEEYWNGELIELDRNPETVYEDDDLIVCSKPPYMSTHPTGKHLFNCATVFYENIHKKTVHSIHRLDRETSGVLLLAKNPKTAQVMTDHFEQDRVSKCYFFIALPNKQYEGHIEFESNERLGAKEGGLKRVYIDHHPVDSKEGKHARTLFRVLEKTDELVVGLAFPQTGRQHQIRVHAMVRGLPLLGDKLYLGSFEMFQRFKDNIATEEDHLLIQIPRHALHAIALKIPYQGKDQVFISHVPSHLKTWLQTNSKIDIKKLEKKIEGAVKDYFNSSSKS